MPFPALPQLPRGARRWGRRLGLAVVVGILGGLAAAAVDWALEAGTGLLVGRFVRFGTGATLDFQWPLLLLPAAAGLLAGIFVQWVSPGPTGHGVDELTRSFHHGFGRMPLRGPAVKAGGAAVVISGGGSAGPEGPIAALGAAIGSTVGRLPGLTPGERRILLLAGCAAGIGAIFRCPLGGALFATSILYREPEFESEGIVPSFVASVVGYSTYMLVRGFEGPMLQGIEAFRFSRPADLVWYCALGPLCGLTAILFCLCFRLIERQLVPRSRLPRWAAPAAGGLATGALACMLPQVIDGRFVLMQDAVDGTLFADAAGGAAAWSRWALLFAVVIVAKCLATGFTVGSGAPGGVLGPAVFLGGATGALLGTTGTLLFPGALPEELRAALIPVGMAGVLAASMRVPLAAMVMITEMTGSYGLIAPLMLVCVTSYVVGRRFGLNAEQVRTTADSPVHAADSVIHVLESWRVEDLAQRDWPMTVAPSARLDEIIRTIDPGTRPVVAVAEEGRLRGVISAADLGRVMDTAEAARLLVASDIMTRDPVTLDPDEDAYSALRTFHRVDHEVLPVVTPRAPHEWRGMLTRRRIVDRVHERLRESHVSAVAEHESLKAIEREMQLGQLVLGLPGRHARVQRLFVPLEAVGKSLRESDLRRRFGIQVIAIEQRDGSLTCPPELNAPLRTEQRLLAVVWEEPRRPPAGRGEAAPTRT